MGQTPDAIPRSLAEQVCGEVARRDETRINRRATSAFSIFD